MDCKDATDQLSYDQDCHLWRASIALALRPNRLKYIDLWDIVWLNRQGITLPVQFVLQKAMDRRQELPRFLEQLQQRIMLLQLGPAVRKDFLAEMRRFLPPAVFGENLETDEFWTYLIGLVTDEGEKVLREQDTFYDNIRSAGFLKMRKVSARTTP